MIVDTVIILVLCSVGVFLGMLHDDVSSWIPSYAPVITVAYFVGLRRRRK